MALPNTTISPITVTPRVAASPANMNLRYTEIDENFAYLESYKAPLASPELTGVPKAPTAPAGTNTTQIASTAFVQTATQLAVPSGTVIFYAASSAPTGYLECDGSAQVRSEFPSLFAAIGTTFGAGNGTTTFNLPDLRGEFIRGWDHGRDVDADRVFGSTQADAFKAHNHGINYAGVNMAAGANAGDPLEIQAGSPLPTNYGDGGTSTETRPRNIALLPCIKI